MHIEILTIGNEILSGDVQDTNSQYLCRQFTGLGGEVRRVTVLPDEMALIAGEVREALQRGAELLVTAGGMGPTDDDRTVAAVAQAVGRPLVPHDEALRMVRGTYAKLAAEGAVQSAALTPSREKMALLPEGAEALANPVGAAPGVRLRLEAATIVCLPGVPAELRGIFEASLAPALQELFGEAAHAETSVLTDCGDESVLAPILRQVAAEWPAVHLKSRATHFGREVKLRVVLSARGPDRATVDSSLGDAEDRLVEGLRSAGIRRLVT